MVDGGAYDGTLGIVAAITAVKSIKQEIDSENKTMHRSIEVIAFSDEEGLRFKSTFLGSRAVAGSFLKHGYLDARDSKGYTLSSVLEKFVKEKLISICNGLSNPAHEMGEIIIYLHKDVKHSIC